MAFCIALGNIIQSFIYLAAWKKQQDRSLLKPSWVERAVAREFIVFCSSILVSQFSSLLITGMDMPIVAAFDFRFAAFYGVASTLSNALIVPHTAIVSSLCAGGRRNPAPPTTHPASGRVLLKTTRFADAVLCLIALPVVLLMPLFLRLWVGQDYATRALLLGEILIVAQCIRLTMFPYMMIGFCRRPAATNVALTHH